MRIGIVSDIHSNLPALETVLADMGTVDALWCLGDFVGYGPWPNECVALLREHDALSIAGNHDLAALGAISTESFNPSAAIATAWTTAQLKGDTSDYLRSLSCVHLAEEATLAHGSPREPVWEYLMDDIGARASFELFSTQLCLVGHTHIPSLFAKEIDGAIRVAYMPQGSAYELGTAQVIANPGSVGQPRDRDCRAAYLIFDTDQSRLEWRRVEYDIESVQERMRQEGLPQHLIDRLSIGK